MTMTNIATFDDYNNIDGGKLRKAILDDSSVKTEKTLVDFAHLMGYSIRLGILSDLMADIRTHKKH